MSCKDWIERVSAHVDGELTGSSREAVEAHLSSCPDCSRAAEEFRKLDDLAHRDRVPPVRGEEWASVLRSVWVEGSRSEVARRPAEEAVPTRRPAPERKPVESAPQKGTAPILDGRFPRHDSTRRRLLGVAAAAAALVLGGALLTVFLPPGGRSPQDETATTTPPANGHPEAKPPGSESSDDSYANRPLPSQPEIEEKPEEPARKPSLEDL